MTGCWHPRLRAPLKRPLPSTRLAGCVGDASAPQNASTLLNATEDEAGTALWLPPNEWHLGPLAQLRLAPGMIAALGPRLPQVLRAISTIESNHPHEPHYYLAFVGVAPESQGRGIGTALLRPILDRCDEKGMAAYLEATTPRNRACYLRQGFEVTEEFRYPKDGPPSWRMWREPRT